MRLHDPLALLLLAIVPLLWWLWRRKRSGAAIRFPSLKAFSRATLAGADGWRWLLPALRTVVLALVAIAIARPQFGEAESRVRGEGIDIVLAVDISGSMLAEDFSLEGERANRLAVVKSVVKTFVERRVGDRIALVLFAGRPYTQCPLTLDHGWLLQNLDRAEIGMIEDGTAVGTALATAAGRLEGSDAESKVIILLTDGQNNAGKISPETAAEAVRALDIKLYTIGAGTRGMAPFPARDFFGNLVYQPTQVDIDEETLTTIADRTGGRYFRATDTESLEKIYLEIDELERTEFEAPQYTDYRELYPWIVIVALLSLSIELFLNETRLRKLPE